MNRELIGSLNVMRAVIDGDRVDADTMDGAVTILAATPSGEILAEAQRMARLLGHAVSEYDD